MFEKNTRLRVRNLLEREFDNFGKFQQTINGTLVSKSLRSRLKERRPRLSTPSTRSSDERNMTRKTRSRQLRVHSAFQPGYCALCHVPYNSLEDHIQLKRHLKLIGDDANFISLKGFDDQDSTLSSLLTLDGIDAIEVSKNFEYSTRNKMPRTRNALMCDRVKDSPMSPVGSDSGHHLRSRKNINYMTPPLEEDSLTEKPEVVKEFRELRSSSRLLAKLTDHITDEVWNSGRPKRACNRTRISADERLVVDNKSYYKVDVLPTKLRSGVAPFHHMVKRFESSNEDKEDDKGLIVKFRKRNSELTRLNNEAENFLFPKKDESSEEDEDTETDDPTTNSLSNDSFNKKVKIEDEESMHSTCSESRGKKRRRTHAEAFIMDNQKYYKFETPGSRLRYQGSYLSPVNWKSKSNGDYKREKDVEPDDDDGFKLNLDEYNFSFESVPKDEAWYQTFQRKDKGEENYAYLNDDNYWDPLILPYQLEYLQPLDPKTCISQYNQIKKCLMEPPSTSTSVGCSTPDHNNSNSSSSLDPPYHHDEDSKISTTMTEVSSASTTEELKPIRQPRRTGRSRRSTVPAKTNAGGKNPRKSPRQHASTLAILSSLIQQRKRKSARRSEMAKSLPTIVEEPTPVKTSKQQQQQPKTDYFSIARNFDEEFNCEEGLDDFVGSADGVDFKSRIDIVDLLNVYDCDRLKDTKASIKNFFRAKPGRKPGRKKKKNLTGWPNRNRRRREHHKEEDDSTIDSLSMNADSEENETCEAPTDSIKGIKSIKKKDVKSENNNKKDLNSLGDDVNIGDCDNNDDRVGRLDCVNDGAVLTNKVNNRGVSLQYQPYVRVQKLDKNRIDNKGEGQRRSTSPKRTNRGQRRMPASPKSPRMLRRPRGRWYRER